MEQNEAGEKKPCCGCGKDDDTVEWRMEPYLYEIHGTEAWLWMCKECEYQSAMDV